MAERDFVRSGQYYSADYLRMTNLDESATFYSMYRLIRCKSKYANDADVISVLNVFNKPDTSAVFRVQSINPDLRFASWEFNADQTATELLPAPGAGNRLVIRYGSIRTESVSGEAWMHDGSFIAFKIYFSNANSFTAGELYIPLEENESLKLTSTQGAKKIYASVNYFIEQVG